MGGSGNESDGCACLCDPSATVSFITLWVLVLLALTHLLPSSLCSRPCSFSSSLPPSVMVMILSFIYAYRILLLPPS